MTRKQLQQQSSLEYQQPYDNVLKSLLKGQEAQILPQFLPGAICLQDLFEQLVNADDETQVRELLRPPSA